MRTFDKEYKLMAVKRIKESGKSVAEVARKLDLSPNTLHGWISKFGKHGDKAFPGSVHLHEADDNIPPNTVLSNILLYRPFFVQHFISHILSS